MDIMEKRICKMETDKRRNNVILQGMELNTKNLKDLKQKVEDFFYENLQLEPHNETDIQKKKILCINYD